MWLAVNAGAIQEDDDQLGYAHFLEHMAFNIGSGIVRPLDQQLELMTAMAPDSTQSALAYALGELERVAQEGIPDDELAAAKSVEERRLVGAAEAPRIFLHPRSRVHSRVHRARRRIPRAATYPATPMTVRRVVSRPRRW